MCVLEYYITKLNWFYVYKLYHTLTHSIMSIMDQINDLPISAKERISSFFYPEIKAAHWIKQYCLYDLLYTICDKYDYPHLICDTIYSYHLIVNKHNRDSVNDYYYGENNTLYKHFALVLDYEDNKRRISWYETCDHTNLDDFINETVDLLNEIPLDKLYYILCNFIYLYHSDDY